MLECGDGLEPYGQATQGELSAEELEHVAGGGTHDLQGNCGCEPPD